MFKFALVALVALHGAIHLMGFVKARNPAALPALDLAVGKGWGALWLLAAVLLLATGLARLFELGWWWALAFISVVISQIAIVAFWHDAKFGTVANVILLIVALGAFGAFHFDRKTRAFETQLDERAFASETALISKSKNAELPAPVHRYLNKVLPEGAPDTGRVFLEQVGTFNTSQGGDEWKAFTATHVATTDPPGFVWAARVAFAPGLSVFVHDTYVARRGTLAPWVAGLVPLRPATDEGGEVARGELLRFLAETPWYPSVLFDERLITWQSVDDRHARAELRDGAVAATVLFSFGEDDLIEAIRAEDRPRLVDGKMLPTPWVGRWFDYEKRSGVLIPTRGEVEWMLEDGPHPYWRGTVEEYRAETR